jgi:hypothetical protein
MGNNPVSGVDPDGRFRSEIGAQFYNLLTGNKGYVVGGNGRWNVNFVDGEDIRVVTAFKGGNWDKFSLIAGELSSNISSKSGVKKFLWNTVGRYYVPDKYSISASIGFTAGCGGKGGVTMHILTRGDDIGVHYTANLEGNVGWDLTIGEIEVTKGYYLHYNPNVIIKQTLEGYNVSGSVGATILTGKVNFTGKFGLDETKRPIWFEFGGSLGWEPTPVNFRGTFGGGYSKLL